MSYDSYSDPRSEALLRTKQERFAAARQGRRMLATELVAAGILLVLAALVAVLADGGRGLSIPALLATAVAYIAAKQVTFPVGSAYTFPAQLVFIPMLFVLPLNLVMLIIIAVNVAEMAPKLIAPASTSRRVAQIAACVGDCWYTAGPVLVLIAFSAQQFSWTHWPVYLLAFAAQVVFDLSGGLLRSWFAERIVPSMQRQMAWLYLTDAALSCGGLQMAAIAEHRPALVLLELPMIALLHMFARERNERMQGTLALSTAYRGTAMLLGDVIEDDDEYTGVHSRAVVDLSVALADRMGLGLDTRQRVEFGALLHDVGKIRVPKEILHKNGPLDDTEWAIMRQHTIYGEEMLQQVGGTLSGVGWVVRHSHERWDGTGYPDGLAGAQIPIESRIITACDAYNAMTTNRPYRPAMSVREAVSELYRCSGTHFDPSVVAALLGEIGAETMTREPVTRVPQPPAASQTPDAPQIPAASHTPDAPQTPAITSGPQTVAAAVSAARAPQPQPQHA